ncbi:hypothetical protein E2C01_005663 [Portunus trituberculatus]|uniref:Uncharacterized protein n=1 Tax=Portunus trituberculatus TaxID=210409 RepID=A0A5B7CX78_PORTR|nr:hypothetical protein [Portunus trituberculatus]
MHSTFYFRGTSSTTITTNTTTTTTTTTSLTSDTTIIAISESIHLIQARLHSKAVQRKGGGGQELAEFSPAREREQVYT